MGTIASAHAAASKRNFRIHELAKYIDWWQGLVIRDKPRLGTELNPDVAKAHLAPGETLLRVRGE